jgi:glycine cleavage system pyridoxal-binding protein P
VIEVRNARAVWGRLKEQSVVAGLLLEEWYPELKDCLLLCVTEVHTREEIERLAEGLGAGGQGSGTGEDGNTYAQTT